MAIWVDPPAWPAHGRLWSHVISDESIAQLHEFAERVGLPARGFEGDHYDVPEEWYSDLVAAGAHPTSSKDLLARLQGAGLRLRKRRGDRGIAVVPQVLFADQGVADVDLIAALRPAPDHRVFCASIFVRDRAGHFAVVFSRRRQEWGPPGGWREPHESPVTTAVRETREEIGVEVDPGQVRAVGYERFRNRRGGHLWHPTGDLMQVFAAELDAHRPPLLDADPGVTSVEWVAPDVFAQRCSTLFWWPLATHVYAEVWPAARR